MSVVKRIIWGSESPDYAIGGPMLVECVSRVLIVVLIGAKRCFFFWNVLKHVSWRVMPITERRTLLLRTFEALLRKSARSNTWS